MTKDAPDIDERTLAVERSAGNLAYIATCYLLVADMLVRGVAPSLVDLRGFPIDILVILLGGALVRLWETNRREALAPSRVKAMLLAVLVAFVVAVVVVVAKLKF